MREFRDFIMRGNVIDLAVAVVIGAAFAAVVGSFVADILTPLLGLVGVPDFRQAAVTVGTAEVRYGLFLNALITFLLTAAALYFLVVFPLNKLAERRKRGEEPPPKAPSEEVRLLTEIRDALAGPEHNVDRRAALDDVLSRGRSTT